MAQGLWEQVRGFKQGSLHFFVSKMGAQTANRQFVRRDRGLLTGVLQVEMLEKVGECIVLLFNAIVFGGVF